MEAWPCGDLPKPGAFTAARPPRSSLTTSVASASPSTSSATMRSGLPVCTTGLAGGTVAERSQRPLAFSAATPAVPPTSDRSVGLAAGVWRSARGASTAEVGAGAGAAATGGPTGAGAGGAAG